MNKKMWMCVLVAAGVLSALHQGAALMAYPEPAVVARTWQFDFSHGQPQPIAVSDIHGTPRWYWYMPFKVTNNTGTERVLVPEITIATDQGDIITAGRDVPASVYAAVRERLGNPLLEHPIRVVGRILQGEDHARETVAIWPAFPHDTDTLNIFVSGLSGETQIINHPVTQEPVPMRKTLMISYGLPGSNPHPQAQNLVPRGDTWIMR